MRVRIVVEEIADRKTPDDQRDAIDVPLAGQLVGPVGDVFLLAAETEGLLEIIALRADFRIFGAGLLRFSVRKAREAQRAVETKALRQLRIEIKLAALPQPHAEKCRRRPGGLGLAASGKAVRTRIGRTEGGIGLRYQRCLRM